MIVGWGRVINLSGFLKGGSGWDGMRGFSCRTKTIVVDVEVERGRERRELLNGADKGISCLITR